MHVYLYFLILNIFYHKKERIRNNTNNYSREINITRKNGILYLENTDTTLYLYFTSPKDEHLKYSPLYYVEKPGNEKDSIAGCTSIYIIEEGELIYLPIVYYCEINHYLFSVQNFNNAFDEQYLSNIQPNTTTDTIAYQDNRIIFKLKK